MLKILLLDCDPKLKKSISKFGFDVSLGQTGFSDGKMSIPKALYEQDIIFYYPKKTNFLDLAKVISKDKKYTISGVNKQSGVSLDDITDFFRKGGVLVSFYNGVAEEVYKEKALFDWIPDSPYGLPTNDRNLKLVADPEHEQSSAFISLFQNCDVKKPVMRELYYNERVYSKNLVVSSRGNTLASFSEISNGLSIFLPPFESTESAIVHFLLYVYPKLRDLKPSHEEISIPRSQKLLELEKGIKEEETQVKTLNDSIGKKRADFIQEANRLEQIVQSDANTIRLIGYLKDAIYDKKGSWHFCFKIIELLYDIYGGESKAKSSLGGHTQINYIKKITNEGYRDTRHSPKPGEVIKPPTFEEINMMIDYSRFLIEKHVGRLIEGKSEAE